MGEIQDLEQDENYQMLMKECLCKIENKNGKGAGFFCAIPYRKVELFVMITTNHLVNEKILKFDKKVEITLNNDEQENKIIIIDDNKKIYTSIKYDTTIIEINPKNDDIYKFLKLDEKIFQPNINYEKIFIIQYISNKEKIKKIKSKGLIKQINDYNLKYVCNSSLSLSGCPLLNESNDKVIGIHKESLLNFNNNGILLKQPLYIYINDILNMNKKNEINIKIKVEKKDIHKNIYFLYGTPSLGYTNYKYNGAFSSFCSITETDSEKKTKEINESNVEIYINNKKCNFNNNFKAEKEGIFDVKIKFLFQLKNCSEMFIHCENIISIDLSFFDSSEIIDTSNMFSGCKNLEKINFSSFDTKNVINMNNMFYNCSNLKNINLSFFNTENVQNMSSMFYNCYNLNYLYLSSFDTKNVKDMSFMFSNCRSLINIDLSSFDTNNVENINYMLYKCYSLYAVNLTSFNKSIIRAAKGLCDRCYNLTKIDLPLIRTLYLKDRLFSNCINLII